MASNLDSGLKTAEFQASPVPAPEALIARAKEMIPSLKARARQCVADRNVPTETIAEMKDAGFFRVMQPKRFGGYEMHPNVFFDIQRQLSEGCMSTAWVYGVVGCHPFQLALFDERAQIEVWGDDQDMLVSSTYQPVGKVERTEGGFHLSGRWPFSSGSVHCGWVLLGAIAPGESEGSPPEMCTMLLPRQDYVIDESKWFTFGLQGTGSHDIVVDRAFVPEYRIHRASDGYLCKNPGQAINTAPLYTMPWGQFFLRAVSSAAFGAGHAAVDAALEIMKSRVSKATSKASKDDQVLQGAIAATEAQLLEMELSLSATFDEIMSYLERGERISVDKRIFWTYQSATVVQRLARLVDAMVERLGSRAIYMTSGIVQPWQDILAARAHVANDPYSKTEEMTTVLTGGTPPPGFY